MQVMVYAIGIGGLYGSMKTELKQIRADVNRLETKQDRYNNLQERMGKAETALSFLTGESEVPHMKGEQI